MLIIIIKTKIINKLIKGQRVRLIVLLENILKMLLRLIKTAIR